MWGVVRLKDRARILLYIRGIALQIWFGLLMEYGMLDIEGISIDRFFSSPDVPWTPDYVNSSSAADIIFAEKPEFGTTVNVSPIEVPLGLVRVERSLSVIHHVSCHVCTWLDWFCALFFGYFY